MYSAYFDETEAATVFLAAGWVARDDEWARFSAAWTAALAAPPSIAYFSHHEAKAQNGEFAGWDATAIEAKLTALVSLICAHDMYGVTGGVRTTTWKETFASPVLSPKQLKGVLKFTHPYQACFHGCVAAVFQLQQEKGFTDAPVNFTFDEQTGLLKDSIKHYEAFRTHFPPQVQKIAGTVASGDDKKLPPLQAADMLCGQLGATLTTGPGRLYQQLVASHAVAQFKSYPPNFQSIPAMVDALGEIWSEKQVLDQLLKHAAAKAARGDKT